jgi:hypothetical protein
MERPRKKSPASAVSRGQASYVLEKLRQAGRVTAAQIKGYLSDMGREIRDLEDRLHRLREAAGTSFMVSKANRVGNGAPASRRASAAPRRKPGRPAGSRKKATPTPVPSTTAKPRKRKFTVTAKVVASRELQGRYLPLLNKFSGKKRQQYAKLAKEKGREAAITQMTAAVKK